MSPRASAAATAGPDGSHGHDRDEQHLNQVNLVGRVSGLPTERVLPSGDALCTFRLVVSRGGTAVPRSKQLVDTLDCAVWGGRLRRSVSTWRVGDLVEVTGAVRRRFYRGGGGLASRVEVEVATARLIRRGATS